MAEEAGLRPLRVAAKRMLTPEICLFELVDPAGGALPSFTAGAHVTVATPTGARRTYSLANDPAETHRYQLGVKAERAGRGGSASLVDGVGRGDLLPVSEPVNDFPLKPAPSYLLIAGGIGITPIMAMARQLAGSGAEWRLIYCTRSPELTAFRDDLAAFGDRVTLHHDGGDPARIFDFWPLFEKPGKGHVYCCGPRMLMDEVRDMTGHWPSAAIHFEDFASDVEAVRPDDTAFTVRRAATGETVAIPADRTILETLRGHGHTLVSSCESGTCGTCKTRLVDGEPDHRDRVLMQDERDDHIMICVSRARSGTLVLDW